MMEFTIKQSILKPALADIQGAVDKKNTIPVLGNVLIESIGDNTIRLTGTDLDITVRSDVDAEIKTGGSLCIQASKLFDLVRLFDSEADIVFKGEDNHWATITSGRARHKIAGVPRENYPETPSTKSVPFKIEAGLLNAFILNTSFAITMETSRFTLSGAKLKIGDGKILMVSTDGHRLAYCDKDFTHGKNDAFDTIIPKKALAELSKMMTAANVQEVKFGEDPNHIFFEIGSRLLATRKLSGTFPEYEKVIPVEIPNTVTFDREEMRNAVRRVSLMASDTTRSLKVTICPGEIKLFAASAEAGEADESVLAEYTGDEITLGFNWQYFMDVLNVVNSTDPEKSGRMAISFKDAAAQTMITTVDTTKPDAAGNAWGYNFKYVLMPLRI